MVLRRLDRVRVKGKQKAEEIFEVVAAQADMPMDASGPLVEFERALQLYFAGDFAAALEVFAGLTADGPAQVFAKRCQYLLDNPPENWDGCWTFTEK